MTASIMAMENKVPMIVFALDEENSIINAANGKITGTEVTVD
jgi:uridylate kinase